MALVCRIAGHSWNGCTCSRCGEHRDEGHKWSAGKRESAKFDRFTCEICGRAKSVPHDFEKLDDCHLKCRVCGLEKEAHVWRGCVCAVCGETREMSLFGTVPIRSSTTGNIIGSKCPSPREAGHKGPWVRDPSNPCIIVCEVCGKRAWDHDLVLVSGEAGVSPGGGATLDFGSGWKCKRCGESVGRRGNTYCDEEQG